MTASAQPLMLNRRSRNPVKHALLRQSVSAPDLVCDRLIPDHVLGDTFALRKSRTLHPERPYLDDLSAIDRLIALGEDLKTKALSAVEHSQKDIKVFLAGHRKHIDDLRQQFAGAKPRGRNR